MRDMLRRIKCFVLTFVDVKHVLRLANSQKTREEENFPCWAFLYYRNWRSHAAVQILLFDPAQYLYQHVVNMMDSDRISEDSLQKLNVASCAAFSGRSGVSGLHQLYGPCALGQTGAPVMLSSLNRTVNVTSQRRIPQDSKLIFFPKFLYYFLLQVFSYFTPFFPFIFFLHSYASSVHCFDFFFIPVLIISFPSFLS